MTFGIAITIIISSLILAWGFAYGGKNIGIGLIEIAKAIKEKAKK